MKPHDLSRVNAAFFTVNGYVSVLFFAFWAADILSASQVALNIMPIAPVHRRRPPAADPSKKSRRRARLSFDDGRHHVPQSDILALGYMANLVRERLHGDTTYFNVNRHINPTDVCVASCRLCAFGKRAKDPTAYTMSMEQVWEVAGHGYARSGHRISHRRRSASGTVARLVLRDDRAA